MASWTEWLYPKGHKGEVTRHSLYALWVLVMTRRLNVDFLFSSTAQLSKTDSPLQ